MARQTKHVFIKSFYIVTDEGDIEQLHIQTDKTEFELFRKVDYGNGPEYQVMFDDAIKDEGTFVKDYTKFDGPTQDFQCFLNRRIK